MNTFTFERSQRMFLGTLMGIGLLCAIILLLQHDPLKARFWSDFLHNSVFFSGIAVMALFFMGASITGMAGWYTVFKRVWESFSLFLIVGIIFMIILGLGNYLGFHHLYHWNDAETVADDVLLKGKSHFLNKGWYLLGTIVIMGGWIYFARKLRALSLEEDQDPGHDFEKHRKMRVWAAAVLPFIGFSSAAVIWLWVMSVDPHWYSTLFAWYSAASWFVAMVAMTIMIIGYLQSKGYYPEFNRDHLHDLGKFLFAFSIFWTYLWFSQFMLIWYGNVGEETTYFFTRRDHYPVLFYGNLVINFVLPFLILLRNDTKRKLGTMFFVSGLVFFGHWIDYFLMIKPGVLHTTQALSAAGEDHGSHAIAAGFGMPGFLEIGMMLGFLGLFIYMVFWQLSKASLIPKNDPYLAESLHHHV
ncbi:MAG: hypothetical protein H6561_05940 [Lewinellaceae bacterium]|nr:hypothetical protein [Lewinellaceae bacterium]HPR00938.1 hypothetical protein [Saprospiraceae bacterium]HQU51398.1 hypothetical protein [Saprospiraceae bacterium]